MLRVKIVEPRKSVKNGRLCGVLSFFQGRVLNSIEYKITHVEESQTSK